MIGRPHKILDGFPMEQWFAKHHPEIIDKWELSEAVEWIELWDWASQEYPDEFSEFEKDYHKQRT